MAGQERSPNPTPSDRGEMSRSRDPSGNRREEPRRLRVILASSDDINARLFAKIFEEVAGWEVIRVSQADEIIPAYRSHEDVDAILLHHNYLPGLPEVVEAIVKEGISVCTIILNTNLREMCEFLLGRGVHRVIDLPCDIDVLCEEIRNAVAEYEQTAPGDKRSSR